MNQHDRVPRCEFFRGQRLGNRSTHQLLSNCLELLCGQTQVIRQKAQPIWLALRIVLFPLGQARSAATDSTWIASFSIAEFPNDVAWRFQPGQQ